MAMRPALFANTPESINQLNSNMSIQGSFSKEDIDKTVVSKKPSRFAPSPEKKKASVFANEEETKTAK